MFVWTPEALSPIKHSNQSLLMIELSDLDGLNDVEIYSALRSYFLLYSMIQSNDSIFKDSKQKLSTLMFSTIVNKLMKDYFHKNARKLVIRF